MADKGKKFVGWAVILFVGLVGGFLLAGRFFQPGCTLDIIFTPPSFKTACPNPYETTINFGRSASARSLRSALEILQERTQGKGQARIFIDQEVLETEFARNTIHPPTGSQGTISVIRQLVTEAGAFNKVDICFGPSEGFLLKLRK